MASGRRIAVVVVARDRAEIVRETIDAITAQDPAPDRLILVANDATPAVGAVLARAAAQHEGGEVVELEVNSGAAGGFHAGLERAVADEGIHAVCCFDDDALPLPGCLAALCAAVNELPDVGSVGAVSHDGSGRLAWQMRLADGRTGADTVEDIRALAADRRAVPVVAMCWHGLMIPADVIRHHGNVRSDLFLQFEDAEFALRLRGAGLVNYLVTDAEVVHPLRPPGRTLTILGREISITHEAPSKEYLSLRNELFVHRLYGGLRFWALSLPLILL